MFGQTLIGVKMETLKIHGINPLSFYHFEYPTTEVNYFDDLNKIGIFY